MLYRSRNKAWFQQASRCTTNTCSNARALFVSSRKFSTTERGPSTSLSSPPQANSSDSNTTTKTNTIVDLSNWEMKVVQAIAGPTVGAPALDQDARAKIVENYFGTSYKHSKNKKKMQEHFRFISTFGDHIAVNIYFICNLLRVLLCATFFAYLKKALE